ncbi:hypothetical protein BKI52_27905 [marine bacterium AO1-C]|nr:hypothetical protein BKI52_27905 [marine bacterium AO1-C]
MNAKQSKVAVGNFGWYVLRAPLFPVVYTEQIKDCHSPTDFKQLFDHPLFKEAIYLASPGLYTQFEKWLQGTIRFKKNPEKEERKLIKSLIKYWLRAAYRCTPFATFAGVSIPGIIGNQTHLVIGEMERYNRIDAEYIYVLTNELLDATYERRYYPNTTLYAPDSTSLRYFERYIKHEVDNPTEFLYQYHLAKVEQNEYVDEILNLCSKGATQQQMINLLTQQDIDAEDAQEFVQDLIVSQVVVSELQISMMGGEYQDQVLPLFTLGNDLLQNIKQAQSLEDFQALQQRLIQLGQKKIPNIQQVFPNFFQIDTTLQLAESQLSTHLIQDLAQVVEILQLMKTTTQKPSLDSFRQSFQQKYGEEFIPLNEVLDPENGIAYPAQIESLNQPFALLNLRFPVVNQYLKFEQNPRSEFLLDLYEDAITSKKLVCQLRSSELRTRFANNSSPALPDTLSVLFSLLGAQRMHIKNIVPSGVSLLGRFCHSNEALAHKVVEVTQYEQATQSEVILAEIVHNPAHPRTYNILNRPKNIRDYKLLLSANGALFDAEEIIRTQDLLVGVVGQEIVLYDEKRQKRVIPCLSNAHNYLGSNYPIYQFLGDLAQQPIGGWSWGLLENRTFLPRVEIDQVVVAAARWLIKKEEDLNHPLMPQKILLAVADNELLIDLHHDLSREILLEQLKRSKQVVVKEILFEEMLIKNKQGESFTNEFVVPFKNLYPKQLPHHFTVKTGEPYPLGTEWLYLKIYCGKLTADELLKSTLYPLAQKLIDEQQIKQWFYIRYKDEGGHHIRLRFKVKQLEQALFQQINQALQQSLDARKIRWVYDTYVTEEMRYGGKETLPLCEQIFYYDSKAIVEALLLIEEDKQDDAVMYQIVLAMQNVDSLLDGFGFNAEEKLALVTQLANGFKVEFNVNKEFNRSLAKVFRSFKKLDTLDERYAAIFQSRNQQIQPIIPKIKAYIQQGICKMSLAELFVSISHMSLNRLFTQKPRQQELVTYDFLSQRYKADLARKKHSSG